ncbi:C39 family peptidase [Paenibacillus hexagrammi]|uniref:C39 family peptidase n=1 Tax=Paenibacillus hexagrammi TaxID=2908839 RepID=A0ABY3SQ04_9BACL|nr:C39 family peptidase [Paenibacillus sp. YPD9-1]UJF36128.1 C39 family peptidase [Paenibacillus sp. YPD9-1]
MSSVMVLSVPFLAHAQDKSDISNVSVSPTEATAAALYQVVLDQKLNEASSWKGKNVTVEPPIAVYDASDDLNSYIVNLDVDNKPAGYVEVANNEDDFPILSFGYQNQQMNSLEVDSLRTKANKKEKKSEKVVVLAPGKFALKSDYVDGSAEITSKDETLSLDNKHNKPIAKIKKSVNTDSKIAWGKIKKITAGEIGTTSDGVTDSLSFETGTSSSVYYSGVGDVNQYTNSLWSGPSGCSPTSAYNVMYYWQNTKGKSNLGTANQDSAILALRKAMGTNNNGGTSTSNIGSGMNTYAQNHGYLLSTASNHYAPSWSQVKSDLASNPSVISFQGQTYYDASDLSGAHTVAGVGYIEYFYSGSSSGHQYMEIHDNWGTTPTNVYVAYGRNYTNLWSVSFSM